MTWIQNNMKLTSVVVLVYQWTTSTRVTNTNHIILAKACMEFVKFQYFNWNVWNSGNIFRASCNEADSAHYIWPAVFTSAWWIQGPDTNDISRRFLQGVWNPICFQFKVSINSSRQKCDQVSWERRTERIFLRCSYKSRLNLHSWRSVFGV